MALESSYEITGAGIGNGTYVYQGEIPAGYHRFDIVGGGNFKLMYRFAFEPAWYINQISGGLDYYITEGASSTTNDDPWGYTWTVWTNGIAPVPFSTPTPVTPVFGNMFLMF